MADKERLVIALSYATNKLKNEQKYLKPFIDNAIDSLKDYLPQNRIKGMLLSQLPLESAPIEQLYFIGQYLNRQRILEENISQFFNSDEIASFQNYIKPVEKLEYPVFKNTIKSSTKEEFTCRLTYKQIVDMYESSLLSYNINTQRVSKINKKGHEIFKMPNINWSNVEGIKKEILNGTFQSNMLTFNIRNTGSESYDFVNGELIVNTSIGETYLDVIDGWHRVAGIYEAYKVSPNIIGDMIITIKNLDIQQARLFINQEAKGTMNNQAGIEYYNSDNNIVKLINDINVYGNEKNNVLFNRFITATHSPENADIPFEIMADNLNSAWGVILNTADIEGLMIIKRYIVDYYNMFMKKINEIEKDAENKYPILKDPMFVCGIVIAASTSYQYSKLIDDAILKMNEIIKRVSLEYSSTNKFVYEDKKRKTRYTQYRNVWKKVGDLK